MYKQLNDRNIGSKIYIEYEEECILSQTFSGTFIKLTNKFFKFKDNNGDMIKIKRQFIKSIHKPGEKIL